MVAETQPTIQTEPLTVVDYERLPDDGRRYELMDGVLIEMPAPTIFHQAVLAEYYDLLKHHVRDYRLGKVLFAPVDVELSPMDVVQPDLIFVFAANNHVLTGKRVVGAPDLVVEATSPESRVRDMVRKRDKYQHAGVREYWLIDTNAQTQTTWALEGRYYVEIPADEDGRAQSIVLPDLTIDVDVLFAAATE